MKQSTCIMNDTAINLGLLVRLESKPGKEDEVANFLREGLALVKEELATTVWFALKLGQSTFGIFDAFADETGLKAHLAGKVAEALFAQAPELFKEEPSIINVEILAAKVPH